MRWIFGLDRLHRVDSKKQRGSLLAAAVDYGASGFDVAPMYANGIGEKAQGEFLASASVARERLVVNTKFGIPYVPYGLLPSFMFKPCRAIDLVASKLFKRRDGRCFTAVFLQESVNESLMRLKTDYIDALFIHEPLLMFEQADEIATALVRLRDQGKILKIGVSGGAPCVPGIARDLDLDVLQAPLALLKETNCFSGELSAYHIRRGLNTKSGDALLLSDYYAAARAVKAETVLFQTTQLAHMKSFAGGLM